MNDANDTAAVRKSEQLDWGALDAYVRPLIAEVCGDDFDVAAPMAVEQFPGGHSNLTYLLRFGTREFVMRRPPFGPVPPRAHDMAREYRILAAVNRVYSLAPRPFLLCEDAGIIGATFYIMERRRGLLIRTHEPSALADNPEARRRASAGLVDALALLHEVDINAHDLISLGKPAGFVERQVRGWAGRWQASQTDELAEMDELVSWLTDRVPPDPTRPSMVHGDFKLDNVMLDAQDLGRVVAVLDWEMSAVGEPLVDLGILLVYWIHTATDSQRDTISTVTHREGWFRREELIERYASRTNCDLSRLPFFEIFAIFKLAVVVQQIFFRYRRGQTDDPRFAALGERVAWLARIASELASRA